PFVRAWQDQGHRLAPLSSPRTSSGTKSAAPLDLVKLAMKTREQRLAYATQHWIAAARLH
ncbi:hypothetical protein, partial [Azotobacter armeniacus]